MGAGPETGGSGSFDPTSIAGLQAWLKADAGTSTTTDGVAVSQWNDQSGNGRNFTQATGSLQPLYKAAIFNGLPVVRFDGVDDFMAVAAALETSNTSFFIVTSFSKVTAFAAFFASSGTAANFRQNNLTGQIQITYNGGNTATATDISGARHVIGVQLPLGASGEIRVDGGAATAGGANVAAQAGTALQLAANGSGGATMTGDVGEVLLYNSVLSAGNRQAVEAYLKAKWATP
jgi:hypothetical protein